MNLLSRAPNIRSAKLWRQVCIFPLSAIIYVSFTFFFSPAHHRQCFMYRELCRDHSMLISQTSHHLFICSRRDILFNKLSTYHFKISSNYLLYAVVLGNFCKSISLKVPLSGILSQFSSRPSIPLLLLLPPSQIQPTTVLSLYSF